MMEWSVFFDHNRITAGINYIYALVIDGDSSDGKCTTDNKGRYSDHEEF